MSQNILTFFLKSTGLINTVTIGNIADIDLSKQTIFPLVHVMPNNASIDGNTITLNLTLFFMDVVDFSKSESINSFDGNDNDQKEQLFKLKLKLFEVDVVKNSKKRTAKADLRKAETPVEAIAAYAKFL